MRAVWCCCCTCGAAVVSVCSWIHCWLYILGALLFLRTGYMPDMCDQFYIQDTCLICLIFMLFYCTIHVCHHKQASRCTMSKGHKKQLVVQDTCLIHTLQYTSIQYNTALIHALQYTRIQVTGHSITQQDNIQQVKCGCVHTHTISHSNTKNIDTHITQQHRKHQHTYREE